MEIKGIYRHFKGNRYRVLGEGICEGERYIIYRQMYGEEGYWMRPFDMFFSAKEQDGEKIIRFARIEDSSEGLPTGEELAAIRLNHSETLEKYCITGDEKTGYTLKKA